MRFRGQCREDLEYIEEMDGQEKDKYNTIVNRYKQQNYTASDDVKKIILRDLKYKNMQFINADMMDLMDTGEADAEENQIYVFAQFFPPGRQTFVTCIIDEE